MSNKSERFFSPQGTHEEEKGVGQASCLSSVPICSSDGTHEEENLPEDRAMAELRQLIAGHVEAQLAELQLRLDDPKVRARELSLVLPEAILQRASQDDDLAIALVPPVEEAVRFSIKRNLKVFADALFPVMGPAIRKAISEALRGMIQSLNEALEKSFSWKGMKWRLEAFAARKPFSEIVLLHSIVYRVEQIFLIHRETGLMLQHVVTPQTELQDADMVSSMLTAIRDFVADSFKVQEQESLETIRVGELSVWIEQGPLAILAVVIRGTAPANLRVLFQETLETVHLEYAEPLESFEGDTAPFEAVRPAFEACLLSQYKQDEKKVSPVLIGISGVVALALLVWIGFWVHNHLRWTDLLTRLNTEDGIIVTAVEKQKGKYVVRGLRDELAIDPSILLQQANMKPDQVSFQWVPYQSLNEGFLLKRVQRILNAPQTVSLTIHDGALVAEGSAPHDWVVNARRLVQAMPGIKRFDTDKLLESDQEELQAFDEFLETLKQEKGAVVTSAGKKQGEYHIFGLLDPLAKNPSELLRGTKLPSAKVIFHWEPYQSLDPSLILQRAKRIMDPPMTVSLQIENGCLAVKGSAPHSWIIELRKWVRTMPGAICLQDNDLVDLTVQELQSLKNSIESEDIFFLPDSPKPIPNQAVAMGVLGENVEKAVELAAQLGIPIRFIVSGHTDRSGSEERNHRLSQVRGKHIADFLESKGIRSRLISVQAVGSNQPLVAEHTDQDRDKNRRVSFRVLLGQDAQTN